MSEPTTEAGKRLPWNERNPDWWRAQVEERGDIAWQWLANEWAEARAAALVEAADKVRKSRSIVNDWFERGYEAGNLSADVLTEAIVLAILEGTDR
jgi:hypothetical protein